MNQRKAKNASIVRCTFCNEKKPVHRCFRLTDKNYICLNCLDRSKHHGS